MRVHDPDAGSPESTRLPVETLHEGWVIVPTIGAPAMSGPCMMVTPADGPEVQPASFVTVNVNDPAGRPVITVLLPEPVVTTPPGLRVMIHWPAGSPLS